MPKLYLPFKTRLNVFCSCSIIFLFIIMAPAKPSFAHKLKLFASAQGGVITGYAYFSGGGKPKNNLVMIKGRDDKSLGEVMTDDEGRFSFQTTQQIDHWVMIESKDGHTAKWLIKKEELTASKGRVADLSESLNEGTNPKNSTLQNDSSNPTPLSNIDCHPLERKIDALREEVTLFQERIFFRDILGGVGYLLGLAGILFYWLGRNRHRKL